MQRKDNRKLPLVSYENTVLPILWDFRKEQDSYTFACRISKRKMQKHLQGALRYAKHLVKRGEARSESQGDGRVTYFVHYDTVGGLRSVTAENGRPVFAEVCRGYLIQMYEDGTVHYLLHPERIDLMEVHRK
jgi:carbon monoxide dehydrogenase subunit G